jgi:antitoxin YefM
MRMSVISTSVISHDITSPTRDRVIVTRNGRPHVIVISIDDFESWQLTRELLAEPGAVQGILAADQEISAGDYHTLDELRAALEERQRQDDGGR